MYHWKSRSVKRKWRKLDFCDSQTLNLQYINHRAIRYCPAVATCIQGIFHYRGIRLYNVQIVQEASGQKWWVGLNATDFKQDVILGNFKTNQNCDGFWLLCTLMKHCPAKILICWSYLAFFKGFAILRGSSPPFKTKPHVSTKRKHWG